MASFGVGVQNRFELLQQPKKDDNTKEEVKKSDTKAEKQAKAAPTNDGPVKKGGKPDKRGKGADTTDARGKRFFDRHSGTGRPIKGDVAKEGHGKFGWGNAIEDYKQGVEETPAAEGEAKAEEAEPVVVSPEDAENAKLKTLDQFYAEKSAKAVEGDKKEVRAPIIDGFKNAIPITREEEEDQKEEKANKGGKGGKKNKKNVITMDEFNQLVKPKPEPKPFKPRPQPTQQAAPAAAAETAAPAEAAAAPAAGAEAGAPAAGQTGAPRGRGGRGGAPRGAPRGGRGGRGGNSEGFRGGRGGGEGGRGGRGRGAPRGAPRGGRGGRGGASVDIDSKAAFPSFGAAGKTKQ